MELSEDSQQEYSAAELTILGKVIDYAERMINEDKHLDALGGIHDCHARIPNSRVPLYRLLRKHGYAKTVVVNTELHGQVIFRLTSNEASIPDASIGICGPHAPLGKLAVIAHVGLEGNSQKWGEYRVTEVRSFDRFDGPDFEPNVRNFLRMQIDGDTGMATVHDLRTFLAQIERKTAVHLPVGVSPPKSGTSASQVYPPIPATSQTESVEELTMAEENKTEDIELDLDDDWEQNRTSPRTEEYYGLSERFFTHQTLGQSRIISRSPLGPMLVEGVAGSGKTSAALGRMKMLTTFNMTTVSSEEIFRELLGSEHDYWSYEYAGQFSEQSCIGFVRTGELIQYLKETCRRIDLPDLPVCDFRELQTRLRQHRLLTTSLVPGRRWMGTTEHQHTPETTTMQWLRATDQAMADLLADQLLAAVPSPAQVEALFHPDDRRRAARVTALALKRLHTLLGDVYKELKAPPRAERFALDGLAARLVRIWDEIRAKVLSPTLLWAEVSGANFVAPNERDLAEQLFWRKAALYRRSGRRMVFLKADGPVDRTLTFHRDPDSAPMAWSKDVLDLLKEGRVIVRDVDGTRSWGVASTLNRLYLLLLPESTETVYKRIGRELYPLALERGLGRVKLRLAKVADTTYSEADDGPAEAPVNTAAPEQVSRQSVEKALRALVLPRLLMPLTGLPDLYLETLRAHAKRFPAPQLASATVGRLEQFRLVDDDIDQLLCIGHLLSRGNTLPTYPSLKEAPFYQAVFVDEAQDFTEQQVYLMVHQAHPRYRAVTVVGDLAQKLHHGSSIDLRACFPGQNVPDIQLTENLRQTEAPGLALFSAMFRARFQGGEPPSPEMCQRARDEGAQVQRPQVINCTRLVEFGSAVLYALSRASPRQTVAVLFPTAAMAETTFKRLENQLREQLIEAELSEKVNLARRHVRHFTDVANAKGLEFDVVVLAHVEAFDLSRAADVNRLYVGVTRARRSLTLLSRKSSLNPQLTSLINDFSAIL